MDCCVAAMTVTSLFLPDPVFGAKVLKKVSEVQESDSAGDPAKVVNNAVAEICTEVLRIVMAVDSEIATIFQSLSIPDATNDFNVTFCSIEYTPSVGQLF